MNSRTSQNPWLKFASILIILQGCGKIGDLGFNDKNETQEIESFQLVHEAEFVSFSIHDTSVSDSTAKSIRSPIYTHIESPISTFTVGDSVALLDVDRFFEYSISIYPTWKTMISLKIQMKFDSVSNKNPKAFHISGTANSADLKWMNRKIFATATADSVLTKNISTRCNDHFIMLIKTETDDSLKIEDAASCIYNPEPVFLSRISTSPVK